jgi:hypothetical protein
MCYAPIMNFTKFASSTFMANTCPDLLMQIIPSVVMLRTEQKTS